MKAEIISVGTEITLGQIVNTNARILADQLRQLDIECHWQTNVDDDEQRIIEAIHQAQHRTELIFICGGLGPTADDVTMASVAKALNTNLQLDEAYWHQLQRDFARRQVKLAPENIRQAYYLAGGQALANPVGLALGSVFKNDDQQTFVVLPGPPREFKAMLVSSLLPQLKQLSNQRTIVSAKLHFVGYPESTLMDEIQDILGDQSPIIATSYVQPDETQVRLTIHDMEKDTAQGLIEQATTKIVAQLGKYYFGTGDDINLAAQVLRLLRQHHLTISAAESLTGGLFQSTLCSVPGASQSFFGGFVTYATEEKTRLLGIPKETIDQYTVVSGQVALAMAQHSRVKTGSDVGIGFTGVAGPDSLDGHPVGEVWVGIQIKDHSETHQLHLSEKMGRQAIRQQSVQLGLLALYRQLQHLS